jgi:phosphoglycerate dehydrogenase-like enzyme
MIAAVTADAVELVRAHAPEGADVRPLTADALADADVVIPAGDDGDLLEPLSRRTGVRLVQVLSAGTDWIEPHVPPGATLCNARGTRDAPVSEWVLAALLGAYSGLLAAAHARRWTRPQTDELAGKTVLILGHGSIGRAAEARLEPFGARVVGVASHARDGVHGVDELRALLPDADALVVLLPLDDATRGLVDAAMLGRLRDGALVVNAGRGPVVDAGALERELATGRLRAVLDVTDPEPLPDDHPLWRAEGLLAITGHLAGDSRVADARAARFAAEQLGRLVAGEPLENVVVPA